MKCCETCVRYHGINQYDCTGLFSDDIDSYYLIDCSFHHQDGNGFSYREDAEAYVKKYSCHNYEHK